MLHAKGILALLSLVFLVLCANGFSVAEQIANYEQKPVESRIRMAEMSTDQLLLLAEDVSTSPSKAQIGLYNAIAGELIKRWGHNVPYAKITEHALDAKKPVTYRVFMIDAACHGTHPNSEDRELVASRIMSIAFDASTSPTLRHLALKSGSRVVRQGVKDVDSYASSILLMLKNEQEPPEVRAGAITALQRIGRLEEASSIIEDILLHPNNYESSIVRHAATGLAKTYVRPKARNQGKTIQDANQAGAVLLNCIRDTNDMEVFCTAIYAVSLGKDEKAYKDILVAAIQRMEQFPDEHVRLTLASSIQKHQSAIIEMLRSGEPQDITVALNAILIRPSQSYVPFLKQLLPKADDFPELAKALKTCSEYDDLTLEQRELLKKKQEID